MFCIQDDELKNEPKSRPHSMTRMPQQQQPSKSKCTQVNFDSAARGGTRDIGTQYEETAETEIREKVEISRVLLSGDHLNSNITNFVSHRLERLSVTEEVWDLFQLVLDDVNTNITDAKK